MYNLQLSREVQTRNALLVDCLLGHAKHGPFDF